jgi:metal-responsive CopG/Arc/MetJ family transcriptional regulator
MAVNPETTARKLVTMPHELAKEIDDFRFEHRIKTEVEAIRRLIELGLQAAKKLKT